MIPIVFYLVLIKLASSQFTTTVSQGFGYIQDKSASRQKCESIHFLYLNGIENEDNKNARLIIWAGIDEITTLGSAAVTLNSIFEYFTNKSEKNGGKLTVMDVKQLFNQLGYRSWNLSRRKQFDKRNSQPTKEKYNIDSIIILKKFGFDLELGIEMFHSMEFFLARDKYPKSYSLRICAEENHTRRYGEVKIVAPIGNFIEGGHAYKYFNIPPYAVEISGQLVSAENCQKNGNHFKCQAYESECNIVNYEKCSTVLKMTQNEIITIEMGPSATFIASTQLFGRLFSSENSQGEYFDHFASGIVFQAPRDHFIKIYTKPIQKIYGKRQDGGVIMERVDHIVEVTHLNHAEIDSHAQSNSTHWDFNDSDWATLHSNYGYHMDFDTLVHLSKSKPFLMVPVTVIILFGLFYCCFKFHYLLKKGKCTTDKIESYKDVEDEFIRQVYKSRNGKIGH